MITYCCGKGLHLWYSVASPTGELLRLKTSTRYWTRRVPSPPAHAAGFRPMPENSTVGALSASFYRRSGTRQHLPVISDRNTRSKPLDTIHVTTCCCACAQELLLVQRTHRQPLAGPREGVSRPSVRNSFGPGNCRRRSHPDRPTCRPRMRLRSSQHLASVLSWSSAA